MMSFPLILVSSWAPCFFVFRVANVYFMEIPIKQKRRDPPNRNKPNKNINEIKGELSCT